MNESMLSVPHDLTVLIEVSFFHSETLLGFDIMDYITQLRPVS